MGMSGFIQIPQQQDEVKLTDQVVVLQVQDQPQAQEQPQVQKEEKSAYETETDKAVEAIGGGELLNIISRCDCSS